VIARPEGTELDAAELAWLARILGALRDWRGVDFDGYRTSTVLRRVRNRMISARARSMAEYLDRLVRDPREADALLERLTIKVSRFFRDAASFEALRRALPAVCAARGAGGLRVWSAGCGQGEEAYSLAMLLAEEGAHASRHVVATDIDPAALAAAARGSYSVEALAEVPAALRERYFVRDPAAGTCRVVPEIRARVELRAHDLAGSAAAPDGRRFDVVCCRNVLIYFGPPLQLHVERLLVRSLAPGGLLWLGEAEWPLPEIAAQLEVVDRKARLFRARGGRETDA
jgi:chemotaxis methyl-accepting protein methylase